MKHRLLLPLSAACLLSTTPMALADSVGARTAFELTKRYENMTSACPGEAPAYMCSGVMLRVLGGYSAQYNGWDPSPFSARSGATSFSYLRTDIKSGHFALNYNSGYIFYPEQQTPEGMLKPEAQCFFLHDADTYERDDKGCGAHQETFSKDSDTCDHYDITTPEQWYQHYTRVNRFENRRRHECGFKMTVDNTPGGARDAFDLAVAAYKYLHTHGARGEEAAMQNEFRLLTWPKGAAAQLPIQAFFYTGNGSGRDNARKYQRDFFNQTHRFVPIVKVYMPRGAWKDVKFRFYSSDQYVRPNATTAM